MGRVAAFAASPIGQIYGATCERYGVDPAASFTDDVLAFNLRAALMVNAPKAESSMEVDEWAAAGRENERAWLSGV